MDFNRGGGILLHPTALFGPYGIGSLGGDALAFLDWLREAGQGYWQICPLAPTGFGNSPYQGFSAFAGNANLIDLEQLVDWGLLEKGELDPLRTLPRERVDFGRLIPSREHILRTAWGRFINTMGPERSKMEEFREQTSAWLNDYALFMVIKEEQGGGSWEGWDAPLRFREPAALERIRTEQAEKIDYHVFLQYLFANQWKNLKNTSKQYGIKIIGDLPIFLSYDSSECWAHPELFQLDEERRPTHVAGVPPDYYSATGQLWGNPLYNWNTMTEDGFAWWVSVLREKLNLYDVLRIDHFRGFESYWAVPYGEETAVNGQWVKAPGSALFAAVREALGDTPIIAEDLGVITDDVKHLITECGFPGMKILQFAFDSAEENEYLPHTFDHHCLVYTGTHDNDTSTGWYRQAQEQDKRRTRDYLNLNEDAGAISVCAAMVRAAMASVADLAIIPLQDLLGLDSNTRFNTPGTLGEQNWSWRCPKELLTPEAAADLRKLTKLYGRKGQGR